MIDGFYAIDYTGATGSGLGVLAITKGVISGADMLGGRYDGTCQPTTSNSYNVNLRVTIPSGTSLVTGATAGQTPLVMDLNFELPSDLGAENPIPIHTPTGPVNVIFRKLRDYPQ